MVAMVHVRDSIVQHQKFHAIFAAALHKQHCVVHTIVSTYTPTRVCESIFVVVLLCEVQRNDEMEYSSIRKGLKFGG